MNPLALPLTKSKAKPQLHNLPIDSIGSDTLPISVLINPHSIDSSVALPRDQILFCYQALLNTIDSLLTKKYTDFDGHTTSNCCHGMALLSWHLIQMALECDLHVLRQEYEQAIHYLEQHACAKTPLPCTGHAPKALTNLACLYILCLVKEDDPQKGGRTVVKNLKILAPIGGNACREISTTMQRFFSNWIATSYASHLKELDSELQVSGASVELWGKYIGPHFIRTDKRGVKYASNLFSMQVTLAYLSQSKAKVALVNDIRNTNFGCVTERYTCLFEGNGIGGFTPISSKELLELQMTTQDEPIIVLGGCVYSDNLNKESLSLRMQPWLKKLTQLILACDAPYPQFVQIIDDPEFNSEQINPNELELEEIINSHSSVKGVSTEDPSFYCLSHIYSSSVSQFINLKIKDKKEALPLSFIPNSLLSTLVS